MPRVRTQPRNAKDDAKKVEIALRRKEVVRLRTEQGLSFPKIAEMLGVSRDTAYDDWDAAMRLDYQAPEEREAAKRAERMKLDEAERRLLEVMNRVHYAHGNGKMVRDEDGNPLIDDGPIIAATSAWVRIMQRRAKLDGLDAPTQFEAVAPEAISAMIDKRCAELGIDPIAAREAARKGLVLLQGGQGESEAS